MADGPRYEHDCDNCTFVDRDGEYDVYVCPQSGMPTVILRYGPEEMYYSGRHLSGQVPLAMMPRVQALLVEADAAPSAGKEKDA